MSVSIQRVETFDDAARCVQLQKEVWEFSRSDLVTEQMLLGCAKAGGVLLAARHEGSGIVGFVFSLPAPLGDRLIQHSHMLAVSRRFRDRGIGRRLKWAQYEASRELGCDRITWTFDPLEARNAYLNLSRLGATASRYYVDLYGETSSTLHSGIGTDRLLAEWLLTDQPGTDVEAAPLKSVLSLPQVIQTSCNISGMVMPGRYSGQLRDEQVLVEIPPRIQELKRSDAQLALTWRQVTRAAFRDYFSRGYEARRVTVAFDPKTGRRRVFYHLFKNDRLRGER